MTGWDELSPSVLRHIAESWLDALEEALTRNDIDRATALLKPDGYWRDLLTFNWDFTTAHGADQIRAMLVRAVQHDSPRNFRVEGAPRASMLGDIAPTLDFFFTFETKVALGRGHVRLVRDEGASGRSVAFTVLTSMNDLKDFPEPVGPTRLRELRENAPDAAGAGEAGDPDVVIVGAGQAGLMLGARLRQLNVKTLIVERGAKVGDTWRKRYRTLKLHNDIAMNHFPYLPFPENWPTYLSKDKVADWLEFYATAMDLDIATSTVFEDAKFDPVERVWTVKLMLADGTSRTLKAKHMVSAMGVAGLPRIPKIAGLDQFRRTLLHSSQPFDEIDVEGKKVVVVGAGTSAHDIAQNFCTRGGDVTMIQRSSITVLSLEPGAQRVYQLYRDNDGIRPINDTDVIGASIPFPLLARLHQPLSRSIQEQDRKLLDGLRKVGFLLDNGEDDSGFYMKLVRYHAGYYLNVGASDLIIEGKIKVRSGQGVARLTETQVILDDGSAIDADIVVLATGYHSLQEQVRKLFGSEVANRIGPIWGIGEDGEMRNMYAPTAQPNFYVLGGGFPTARYYSKFTALYIKADLEGLVPPGIMAKASKETSGASGGSGEVAPDPHWAYSS
ncbi:FAD-dependent pyridine nucleotide-disulfide oxidoreductase [Sphingobium chlorophenolicum L-1]|uniref:FAD-dependent pyridine nucleotide-disulfide oxidoreductase n=1 Tax=Sphingobium chlorophenolicum L-1 TaxID=690566 RepID=F6F3C8_SPHCR|nr:NAD(P)/FAD-dependent oxidoreductase [Sphingobium chlorophenolicum]AEG50940.1 FAD-dependent pyridine nucleotide-disulfide oxidoreductase [Sphingobium chlorophenolicum L-1]